eukprot:m.89365 g.89365  ORF g.89365 m.89365 type:complete len:342 (-) comp26289_c1_seq1:88-1113(-)
MSTSGSDDDDEEFVVESIIEHTYQTLFDDVWRDGLLFGGTVRRLRLTVKWDGYDVTSFENVPENTSLKGNTVVERYFETHSIPLQLLEPDATIHSPTDNVQKPEASTKRKRRKKSNLGLGKKKKKVLVSATTTVRPLTEQRRAQLKKQRRLCLRDIVKEHAYVRTRIRDDGSCWVYAVLACLGLCEHAKSAPFRKFFRRNPTKRDCDLDRLIRQHIFDHGVRGADVLKMPDYHEKRPESDFFGSYGHPCHLAAVLNVIVADWDENDLDNADPHFTVDLVYPCGMSETVSCDELNDIINRSGTIVTHVGRSRDIENHFEAWVDPRLTWAVPDWLTNKLEALS